MLYRWVALCRDQNFDNVFKSKKKMFVCVFCAQESPHESMAAAAASADTDLSFVERMVCHPYP